MTIPPINAQLCQNHRPTARNAASSPSSKALFALRQFVTLQRPMLPHLTSGALSEFFCAQYHDEELRATGRMLVGDAPRRFKKLVVAFMSIVSVARLFGQFDQCIAWGCLPGDLHSQVKTGSQLGGSEQLIMTSRKVRIRSTFMSHARPTRDPTPSVRAGRRCHSG